MYQQFGRLFDVYLAVDWSARSVPSPAKPVRDALWVAEGYAHDLLGEECTNETYWRTRKECVAHIRGRLLHHIGLGRRVLIGFDFPYGYPSGYADALGLRGSILPWKGIWEELTRLIMDDESNANNRFAVAAALNAQCGGAPPGPLWGCPMGGRLPTLAPTSPTYPYPVRENLCLERLRWVDKQIGGLQPVWKLYGNGSVGGQTLLGIPAVYSLRYDPMLVAFSKVWPFETGFTPKPSPDQGPTIIHAEIWPGLVSHLLDTAVAIRDQAQVRAVVQWMSSLDTDRRLNAIFAEPPNLSPEAVTACLREEGWILGARRKTQGSDSNPPQIQLPLM